MKPINQKEISAAYRKFIILFTMLLLVSLSSFFLYLKAAEKEYVVLKEQYEEVENLMNSRADINRQFAQINQYFRDIGQGNADMSAIARKRVLQNEIAKGSGHISRVIDGLKADSSRASLKFYRQLNRDVILVSRLQDSLFSTKNLIESKRMQLESCIQMNNQINKVVNQGSIVGR
ncbi:MAG: hypothetical protein ACN6ON_05615 [Sphingobacterium sp.]